MESNWVKGIIIAVCFLVVSFFVWIGVTPGGRAWINKTIGIVLKADDDTLYEHQRTVENSCRTYMASYEADRIMYEQYKDSETEQLRERAEGAKVRANRTASTYNNYVLKNKYVWKENVPEDIKHELPYIE